MSTALEPRNVGSQQWRQAIDVARETCARYFSNGRSPAEAVRAHGLDASGSATWVHAVNLIAELHCGPQDVRNVA